MELALYQGIGPISRAIRFITRSKYSHAAFRFDAHATQIASRMSGQCPFSKMFLFGEGCVVEAWQGGVRNSANVSQLHHARTKVDIFSLINPLNDEEESILLRELDTQIGDPYSYWNVFRFITKRPGNLDGSWFCSELCFEDFMKCGRRLLERTEAWEVPPGWLDKSPLLKFEKTLITNGRGW